MFVLFGATGDIHKKKIYPSLLRLYETKVDYHVIGVSRRDMSIKMYHDIVKESLEKNRLIYNQNFFNQIDFTSGSYDSIDLYVKLYDKIMFLNEKT